MSGTFTTRVNRAWAKAQPNMSAPVFFWEFINYINSHSGFVWRGYGTNKLQTGITPPAAWLTWNTAVDPIPFADNSWVVFEAVNSCPWLLGTGTMAWQAKLQVTTATGFDDCNVADVGYGFEGSTNVVCMRSSVMGGWTVGTLEFTPATGEDASDNYCLFEAQDEEFMIDFVGDDETILWRGTVFAGAEDKYQQSRSGYLGMINCRSRYINYPFLFTAGTLARNIEGAGRQASNGRNIASTSWQWNYGEIFDGTIGWPSYSLWSDGTKIESHRHNTWDIQSLPYMETFVENGADFIYPNIMLAQWKTSNPNRFAIIGEYRHLVTAGLSTTEGQVLGTDPQWIQFGRDPNIHAGIAMRWPLATAPIW